MYIAPQRRSTTFLDHLWDPTTGRAITTVLIITVFIAFLWGARETLVLFLFAILFAYFLAPPVRWLQGPLRGRGRAIIAVYLVLIGILVGVGFIAGPAIGAEAKQLTKTLPSLLNRFGSGELIAEFGRDHHFKPAVVREMQNFVESHRAAILNYGKRFASSLAAPASHAWWLILIPILSIFFLKEGDKIASGTTQMGRSTNERSLISEMLQEVNVMLGSYIRAQMILAALTLTAYTCILSLMRVPYSFVLGPLGGFLEFIPVVGPAVGAAAIVIIAILAGYSHTVWLVLFLGCWRILQDYVNAPRIMGKSLEINPLLTIFAVLCGGEIAGVVGALVAVPVAATLRIVGRQIRDRAKDEQRLSSTETPTGALDTRPLSLKSETIEAAAPVSHT